MPGKPTTKPERQAMFIFYLEGHTYAEVAERFKRDPNTVSSIAHKDGWEEKSEKIHNRSLERAAGRKIRENDRRHEENLKGLVFARDALLKEISTLFKEGDERLHLKAGEALDKLVAVTKALDPMLGIQKPGEGEDAGGQGLTIQGNNILLVLADRAKRMSDGDLDAAYKRLAGISEGKEDEAHEAGLLEQGEEQDHPGRAGGQDSEEAPGSE